MHEPEGPALDPWRLMIAAHELGHALAWHDAGLDVTAIRVRGRGSSANGEVSYVRKPYTGPDQARRYLVGIFAGIAAGERWIDATRQLSHADHNRGCGVDLASYQRNKDAIERPVRAHLQAEARSLVLRVWPRILRMAPRLALRGTIKL